MDLLTDEELERSAVVANCRMNRDRGLFGSNGYDRELGFDPLEMLDQRAARGRPAAWLDLCCGAGKALVQAAEIAQAGGLEVEIIGVDLIGTFPPHEPFNGRLRFVEGSLRDWSPVRSFDLITCIHGLHYVGDKLGAICRAVSWLAEDGRFVASLDPSNVRLADGRPAARRLSAAWRGVGLGYNGRKHLLTCEGRREPRLPFRYLGADDRAGPNYTGQPAVDSWYEVVGGPGR